MSIQLATEHLKLHGDLYIGETGRPTPEGVWGTFQHFFSLPYHASQVQKIISFIGDSLKSNTSESKKELLDLANALITRYSSDKSVEKAIRIFDREIASLRDTRSYAHSENKSRLNKWTRAAQPKEIFHQFPEFADFLHESKLLSQIKVTKDTIQIIDGEPSLMVEDKWIKASELMSRFSIEYSKDYNRTFVVDRTGSVYTYLDNGLGLQKYHPFLTVGGIPLSVLKNSEIDYVRTKANTFIRPEELELNRETLANRNKERPFVLQVVTSNTGRGNSNLSQTLLNPRHAYLRIVAGEDLLDFQVKKGDVFEFGFGWKQRNFMPLEATQGRFSSPDPWEYRSCNKRYTTHIPVSSEEAFRLFQYALNFHRRNVELGRAIGFQIADQNCTVFVRKALEQAGIVIPTEIGLKPLLMRIAPDAIKRTGVQIAVWTKSASTAFSNAIQKHTPTAIANRMLWGIETLQTLHKIAIESLAAFILAPMHTLLGGMFGAGGESFNKGEAIKPQSSKIKNWFDLTGYRYNLPAILQEWQRQQPSTDVVDNPVRLTIVPNRLLPS